MLNSQAKRMISSQKYRNVGRNKKIWRKYKGNDIKKGRYGMKGWICVVGGSA